MKSYRVSPNVVSPFLKPTSHHNLSYPLNNAYPLNTRIIVLIAAIYSPLKVLAPDVKFPIAISSEDIE